MNRRDFLKSGLILSAPAIIPFSGKMVFGSDAIESMRWSESFTLVAVRLANSQLQHMDVSQVAVGKLVTHPTNGIYKLRYYRVKGSGEKVYRMPTDSEVREFGKSV